MTFSRLGPTRGLALLVYVVALLASPAVVLAHTDLPARLVDVRAGPYPLTVGLYNDPPHAGSALNFSIDPVRGFDPAPRFTAVAVPGDGVDATIVRGQTRAHADVVGGTQGEVNLPVAGHWLLQITADGPAGTGTAVVQVDAVPPPAIPVWLGWLIGLAPVYGFVGFVLARRARRARLDPRVVA